MSMLIERETSAGSEGARRATMEIPPAAMRRGSRIPK